MPKSLGKRKATGTTEVTQTIKKFKIPGGSRRAVSITRAPRLIRTGGLSLKNVGGKDLNFIDVPMALSFNAATPGRFLLNGCVPGNTQSTRIGRKITIKSIEGKFYIWNNLNSESNIVRAALVWDKQPNATAAAITDVWNTADPSSLRNLANKERFTVLWDSKQHALIGNATPTGATVLYDRLFSYTKAMQVYKKVTLDTTYNVGTSGDIGDIQTGALFLFLTTSDAGTAATEGAQIHGNFRIRYEP